MRTRDVTAGMLSKVDWPSELPGGKPALLQAGLTPEEARILLPAFRRILDKLGLTHVWQVYTAPVTHTKGPQVHGIFADLLNRAPSAQPDGTVGDQLAEEIEGYRVKQYLGVA